MTKIDSFPDVAKKVESIVGENGLNVLINNAGVAMDMNHLSSIKNLTPEDYSYVFSINVYGPIFLTKVTNQIGVEKLLDMFPDIKFFSCIN